MSFFLVSLVVILCWPPSALGQPRAPHGPPASVTVVGSGTAAAVPDTAEITAGVASQAPTAAQALAVNSAAMEKVLKALDGLGVGRRDIQTTSVGVQPQRRPGRPDGQPPDIVGYEVTNQVRVRVRDLGRLGRVLDELVGQGANLVYGIRFGVQDSARVLDEARRNAMADARRKAELYANAAGVKLGRLLLVQEGGALPRLEPGPRALMSAAVPIASGEEEVQATVSVTYAIDP